MQYQELAGIQSTTGNTAKTNIILVHGLWADASSWSKVIPILQDDGNIQKLPVFTQLQ
jgi:pimeloyl-ACP methyl ester carboxylesterase